MLALHLTLKNEEKYRFFFWTLVEGVESVGVKLGTGYFLYLRLRWGKSLAPPLMQAAVYLEPLPHPSWKSLSEGALYGEPFMV